MRGGFVVGLHLDGEFRHLARAPHMHAVLGHRADAVDHCVHRARENVHAAHHDHVVGAPEDSAFEHKARARTAADEIAAAIAEQGIRLAAQRREHKFAVLTARHRCAGFRIHDFREVGFLDDVQRRSAAERSAGVLAGHFPRAQRHLKVRLRRCVVAGGDASAPLGGAPSLHIIEESYFAEIIDPKSGEAIADGGIGELVLTPLGREANPLLRYRTGDLVRRRAGRAGRPSHSDRRDARPTSPDGFVLEGGILGRTDDMLVVRGVNIFPSAVDAVIHGIGAITEYRVQVRRAGEMTELSIEVESNDDTAAQRVETALGEAFALRIPVARVASGTLPRFELKARRWVR